MGLPPIVQISSKDQQPLTKVKNAEKVVSP